MVKIKKKIILLVLFGIITVGSFVSCRTDSITDYIHEPTNGLVVTDDNIGSSKLKPYQFMGVLCKPWIYHLNHTSQGISLYCYSKEMPNTKVFVKKAVLLLSGEVAYEIAEEKAVAMSFNEEKKLFSGKIVLFDRIDNVKFEAAKKIEFKVTIAIGEKKKTISYLITPSVRTYLIQR